MRGEPVLSLTPEGDIRRVPRNQVLGVSFCVCFFFFFWGGGVVQC